MGPGPNTTHRIRRPGRSRTSRRSRPDLGDVVLVESAVSAMVPVCGRPRRVLGGAAVPVGFAGRAERAPFTFSANHGISIEGLEDAVILVREPAGPARREAEAEDGG